jgi:putative transcriptional regulator
MREHEKANVNLAGSLLLAHPAMRDPNFRRSVVLLSAHGDDGAMGVVVNRPLEKRLGELNLQFAAGPLADVPVYRGGPVQTAQLILAAWQSEPLASGFRLYFGIDVDKAEALAAEGSAAVRAFLGYSGWSKGQLESELRHNAWVVTPADPNLFGRRDHGRLWREILGGLSPEWRIMAGEPDEPALN